MPDRVRVLALGEDEVPGSSPVRIGDRLYFTIGDHLSQSELPEQGSPFTPTVANPRVMSTGLCGESPRLIADGVLYPRESERWPGEVVASTEEGTEEVVLDPEGNEPPRVVFTYDYHWGRAARIELGVLTVVASDGPVGRLQLVQYPATVDDPVPEPVVLLDDVWVDGGVQASETEAFVVRGDHTLVQLDLGDHSIEELATDVVEMALSEDAAWLVYTTDPQPDAPAEVQPLFLLERSSGIVTELGDVESSSFSISAFSADDLAFGLPPSSGLAFRIVHLPALTTADVPLGLWLVRKVPDGRWLAETDDAVLLYDADTGVQVELFDSRAGLWIGEDAVEMVDVRANIDGSHLRDEGVWEHADYATAELSLVAHRATLARGRLADERPFTVVDVDDGFAGNLVLIDPDLSERRIDDRVFMAGLGVDSPVTPLPEGVIVYGVHDGARSGVWLARPE